MASRFGAHRLEEPSYAVGCPLPGCHAMPGWHSHIAVGLGRLSRGCSVGWWSRGSLNSGLLFKASKKADGCNGSDGKAAGLLGRSTKRETHSFEEHGSLQNGFMILGWSVGWLDRILHRDRHQRDECLYKSVPHARANETTWLRHHAKRGQGGEPRRAVQTAGAPPPV